MARALLRLGPRAVILKLGEKGVFLDDGTGGRHVPGLRRWRPSTRRPLATHSTAPSRSLSPKGGRCRRRSAFANAAAAISVTRLGAQASIPDRGEVEAR